MDRPDWAAARRSGDAVLIDAVREARVATLSVLDQALGSSPFLLGAAFTLADLNVASTLSQPHEGGRIDWQRLDPHEVGLHRLGAWLGRCTSRDSWKRVVDYP